MALNSISQTFKYYVRFVIKRKQPRISKILQQPVELKRYWIGAVVLAPLGFIRIGVNIAQQDSSFTSLLAWVIVGFSGLLLSSMSGYIDGVEGRKNLIERTINVEGEKIK